MKSNRKKEVVLALAFIGACIFYEEYFGINILIFNILSAIVLYVMHPTLPAKRFAMAIAPAMACALFLSFYPQLLTYIIWLFFYLAMWTQASVQLRPLLIPLQGLVSIVESLIPNRKAMPDAELEESGDQQKKNTNLVLYGTVGAIAFVFILLYANSNPVIGSLFGKIHFTFYELGFLSSIGLLYLLLYGLVVIKRNKDISAYNLFPLRIASDRLTEKEAQEFTIGKLSIWIVGVILCIVNIIDLTVLFSGQLPEGVTYSEYVHQGFFALIFSMALAIGLIIFFFRGQVNFHEKIQELRTSSYFWIGQNLLLAFITAHKNMLYVEAYGLTYKRIAVFLWLICVAIGLILSIQKVKSPITNWSYFNKLSLYASLSAIAIGLVPYDLVITHYNLDYAQTKDLDYILNLRNPDYHKLQDFMMDSGKQYAFYTDDVRKETQRMHDYAERVNWQSWTFYVQGYKK